MPFGAGTSFQTMRTCHIEGWTWRKRIRGSSRSCYYWWEEDHEILALLQWSNEQRIMMARRDQQIPPILYACIYTTQQCYNVP